MLFIYLAIHLSAKIITDEFLTLGRTTPLADFENRCRIHFPLETDIIEPFGKGFT